MKNTKGHDALAANGIAPRRDYGRGTEYDGDGPDALAWYISGAQWADELDLDPDTPISELGSDAWKAVRHFCNRFDLPVTYGDGGLSFADLEAVSRNVWHFAASPKVSVTRGQVAQFAEDTLMRDPHEVGVELEQARRRRYAERRATEQALKPAGIPRNRPFTLAEVERVGAAASETPQPYVAHARSLIERANLLAWSAKGVSTHAEHTTILTAAELHKLGMPVADIAAMTPATADDHLAALASLEVERQRHRNDVNRMAKTPADGGVPLAGRIRLAKDMTYDEPTGTIVAGLVYERTVTHWIGDGNTFKTFTVLALACSVASGRDFTHQLSVPSKRPVLYLCGESRRYGLGGDIEAWCQHQRVSIDSLELYGDDDVVQLADDKRMAELTAFVVERGIKLVVVDTQSKATRGLNENDATDMGTALGNLAALTREANAAAIVIHHTARHSQHGRGSTVWYDDTDTTVLQNATGGLTAEFSVQKQKSSPSGAGSGRVYPVGLVPVTVRRNAAGGDGIEAAGDTFSTLVAAGRDPLTDAERAQHASRVAAEHEALLVAVNGAGAKGITVQEAHQLAAAQGVEQSQDTVRRALKTLVEQGAIAQLPAKRGGAKLFAPLADLASADSATDSPDQP